MNLDIFEKMSDDELKKLSDSELMEILENYAEKEHTITFDDSKIQIE